MEDVVDGAIVDAPTTVIRYFCVVRSHGYGSWFADSRIGKDFATAEDALRESRQTWKSEEGYEVAVFRLTLPA